MVVFGTPRRISAISLARYAEIINYTDCAFFGVSHPDNENFACREIWTKPQRDDIAFHLAEAQAEIENVVGYPLSPKWIVDEVHPFGYKIVTYKTKVIELGIEAIQTLGAGVATDVTTDPATITIATILTSTDGIKVYYPGTFEEIFPSDIQITGGNLVISVPKCRLVEHSLLDNPGSGLDYAASIYQATVDVKRYYNDSSQQIKAVWPHGCNTVCQSGGCTRYTASACGVVLDGEIGEVSYNFAKYASGSWTPLTKLCCIGNPSKLEISYHAGMSELDPIAETAIIRLAHSKMPFQPCGCDAVINMWRRDATIPQILSVERLECPFGLSNGAWMAWKFAGSISVDRMTVFG
jgi:hypothetical protein